MRSFVIDTDTASDDAVAILMALATPDVEVKALTTVAGNVGVEQATANALLTAEIAGVDVPILARRYFEWVTTTSYRGISQNIAGD